jgi:hypothetical protein
MTGTHPRRVLVALAVVFVLGSVGIGGLDLATSLLRSRFDKISTIIPQADRLSVTLRAGSVALRPSTDANVHVSVAVSYGARRPELSEESTASGVALAAQCVDIPTVRCTTSYVIDVPAAFAVDVRGAETSVSASDLTGPMRVEQDGAITLDRISGPLELHSTYGQITGSALRSPTITATAGIGSVTLDVAAVPTALTVHGGGGDVSIAVPGEVGYQVSARSANGRARVTVAQDAASSRSITVDSDGGDIRIGPHRGWSSGDHLDEEPPLPPPAPIAPPRPAEPR